MTKYTIWFRIKNTKTFHKFGEYIESTSKNRAYERCHEGVSHCAEIAYGAPVEEIIIKKKRNQKEDY